MQLPRIAKKKYEKIVKLQHKIGAIEKDFFTEIIAVNHP